MSRIYILYYSKLIRKSLQEKDSSAVGMEKGIVAKTFFQVHSSSIQEHSRTFNAIQGRSRTFKDIQAHSRTFKNICGCDSHRTVGVELRRL